MNETEQIREDTKPIPDLKEIQAPPQAVEAEHIQEEQPMAGRISSLNASAAASILLYEAVRQRLG